MVENARKALSAALLRPHPFVAYRRDSDRDRDRGSKMRRRNPY